ncbi:uncharacterized protein LOC135829210 [Sycon ciliatum]|uniref:uncharacterized protein LOC135829210 n=1 Tax=Sycon ciliatum TaxID=27933 RepID=UPI0031F660D6
MAECLESDETESVADPNLGFVKAPRPTRETSCNFQSRFMIEDDNNILGVEKNVHPLSCFFKNQSSRPRVTQVEDNNDVLGVDQNLHPPRCSKYFEQQNPSLPQATLDIIHSSKTDPDNASLYESHKRDTSVQSSAIGMASPGPCNPPPALGLMPQVANLATMAITQITGCTYISCNRKFAILCVAEMDAHAGYSHCNHGQFMSTWPHCTRHISKPLHNLARVRHPVKFDCLSI